MFAVHSQFPSSTSLLLQCSYHSKICTNPRATKIDGSLHRLCELHRRKANLSQLRLHNRKRTERAQRRRVQSEVKIIRAKEVCSAPQFLLESITVTANYPKRACQAPLFRMESSIVNPIPFRVVDADKKMNTFGFVRPAPTNFTHEEVEILELLLLK